MGVLTPPLTPPRILTQLAKQPPSPLPVQDDYVTRTLRSQPVRPPLDRHNWYKELVWLNVGIIFVTPVIGLVGAYYTELRWETALFSLFYYFFTGLGITAGYHRLWAHRSYNATRPLQYILALAGAGAVEGSIKWWSRDHRAHHRYTDTELDPYNAHRGLYWSHIGWIMTKPRTRPGMADITDLKKSDIVQWQHKHFVWCLLAMGFILPAIVPWLLWDDLNGGIIYAAILRLVVVHHSTFCVNSLAHWLGEAPFDDKNTPRDHLITALVTIGEGYHNFHHQFPMDYRNAIKWYQYDPTKWFIWGCKQLGLASHLKVFPDNEVRKGQLTMHMKKLREMQDDLAWPEDNDLPVVSWETFQEQASETPLVLISGFIHDVSRFLDEHPGGRHHISQFIGQDATAAFFGGVYEHSNAAHNLLAMKRVGVLHGGQPHILDERQIPPSQKLRIAEHHELISTHPATRDYLTSSVTA
ncbi:delta 9-fatty acid desaturase protein [Infundibulicybe gibba]|nr:delta 9-fatty acid desaturase protein [Infundibulicybe gibba]